MKNWQAQAEKVRQALADPTPIAPAALLVPRDLEGHLARKMEPLPGVIPRQAAVLLLFYPQEDELWFPLTVRSNNVADHKGEVSLPGGSVDPEDTGLVATAVRETHEELGIEPGLIEIWGLLTTLYIPHSNFSLTPIVGFTAKPPQIVPNPTEIATVFNVSLAVLLNPATVVVEEWLLHEAKLQVPFFALQGHKVWGATALLLSELVARLHRQTFSV